jgi:hypothetical protein
MRPFRHLSFDIDSQLEEAARAKQQLDAEQWRAELRPRVMRLFTARTTKLTWSRALLKLVVAELFPDDLFTELVGNLNRVPRRQWPHVIAIAVALRHSWRRDGLTRIARGLRISLTTTPSRERSPQRRTRPSPHRFSDSPRRRQGSPLRFDPAKRGWRP